MNKGIRLWECVESNNSNGCNKFGSFPKSTKKFIAFTLAETLIVMGIIGIVATLTIPNLNSSTNNMEKVTKVKKIYAELTQAHERATAVYGPVETWFTNLPTGTNESQRYFDRITEFMKLQKSCRTGGSNCGKFYMKGTSYTKNTAVVLISGAVVGIDIFSSSCNNSYTGFDKIRDRCGVIYVDIDGKDKGKNTFAIDQFAFNVGKRGIKPAGDYEYVDTYLNVIGVSSIKITYSDKYNVVAGWVIENGNMDYLDVDSDGKCKNNPSRILGYGEGMVQSCK